MQEWSLRIEQQLSQSTVLRIGYVGSHGYHGWLNIDANAIPAQICATTTCASGGNGTARGTVNQGALYLPVQPTRPNPVLGAGFFWYTEGNSSYNALQIDVMHRLAHGLEIRGNFTWSKNLDLNSAPTGAQASNEAQMVEDPNYLPMDYGKSAFNVAAQSSISALYELPFGHGKTFFGGASGMTERFIGGWQLNSIVTLLSGFPFTPQDGSNRSGDGDTRNPDRPNLNPTFTGPIVTGNPNRWFNPTAFVLETPGTWGNVWAGRFQRARPCRSRSFAVQALRRH